MVQMLFPNSSAPGPDFRKVGKSLHHNMQTKYKCIYMYMNEGLQKECIVKTNIYFFSMKTYVVATQKNVSRKGFVWAPKTQVKLKGKKIITMLNMLKKFAYLDLCMAHRHNKLRKYIVLIRNFFQSKLELLCEHLGQHIRYHLHPYFMRASSQGSWRSLLLSDAISTEILLTGPFFVALIENRLNATLPMSTHNIFCLRNFMNFSIWVWTYVFGARKNGLIEVLLTTHNIYVLVEKSEILIFW